MKRGQIAQMSKIANNMQVILADRRLTWRVINYLQRDAVLKGISKGKYGDTHSNFESFWYNMDEFMPALREDRLYVVLDSSHHLMAYFITRHSLEHDGRNGTLPIDIFEVLPKYRKRGVGSFMVSRLKGKASRAGFHSLKVLPANDSDNFWNKRGFYPSIDSHGFLLLAIA
jgi:GNAT superfamily N-acetyltransferase